MLYSISYHSDSDFFFKQVVFLLLGAGILFVISLFHVEILKQHSLIIVAGYVGVLVLLAALLFLVNPTRGIVGWFQLGPVSFQPVELAKLVLILMLAKYFSVRHIELYRARHVLISGSYALIPFLLVLQQPDLGSAFILFAIWLGMVVVSGIQFRHLLLVVLGTLLMAVLAWNVALVPYQKDRILTYINPQSDPLGQGYSRIQSLIAIGSGSWLGSGIGRGLQTEYGFLPVPHTDFIFAALVESLGFLGGCIILLLYGILFWRLLRFALSRGSPGYMRPISNFARLTVVGIAIWIFSQVFVNIGMNIGLLPVTGLTLPFISYGGSSLVSLCIAVGKYQSFFTRSH